MKEKVLPSPPFSKTSFMFFFGWRGRKKGSKRKGKQTKREASKKGKQTRATTRRRAFLVFRFAVEENLKSTFSYCRGDHQSPIVAKRKFDGSHGGAVFVFLATHGKCNTNATFLAEMHRRRGESLSDVRRHILLTEHGIFYTIMMTGQFTLPRGDPVAERKGN